jgi:hypothetical protein
MLLGAAMALFVSCGSVLAGSGDVYVPAHRSKDGTFVPANVPTSSGGTRSVSRLGHSGTSHPTSSSRQRNGVLTPIFVNAKPIQQG